MKKSKSLQNIRFAVELEVVFPNSKISEELIAKHRVIQGWEIEFDGSLDNKKHESEGAEYRPKNSNKLFFNADTFSQIKEIIALIKVHRGHVDERCGGHIHVDMTHFSDKEICNILQAFILHQDEIAKQFKVLPHRLVYCKKIPKNLASKLIPADIGRARHGKVWGEDYFAERNYMLNIDSLRRHKTLEFRLFNGTIAVKRLKENVRWAIKFCIKYAKLV